MHFYDGEFRLTKHGRRRFIERIGKGFTDTQILLLCHAGLPRTDYKPVWKPDKNLLQGKHYRLVTIIPRGTPETDNG